MTLTTGVAHSGRKYSTMRSAVPRFRPNTAPDMAHLGPGYVVPELAKPYVGCEGPSVCCDSCVQVCICGGGGAVVR